MSAAEARVTCVRPLGSINERNACLALLFCKEIFIAIFVPRILKPIRKLRFL